MRTVPEIRIQAANDAAVNPQGRYVLYWMVAARRTGWNFALQRAVEWATDLGAQLLVFEPLRNGYEHASDRLHRFILDGMRANAAALEGSPIGYFPYVEVERGQGKGLLRALAEHACVVVTDEYPCFMLPRMVAAGARQCPVKMETVDGNGLFPLRAADERVFPTAYAFRRFLQKNLPEPLRDFPKAAPLQGVSLAPFTQLPRGILDRWPRATPSMLKGNQLDQLPIDHHVPPVELEGGQGAAQARLKRFVKERLSGYADDRNDISKPNTSGLSPYLHFGHVSSHEVFAAVARSQEWKPGKLGKKTDGKRRGWWGMDGNAEGFLDQLVTWRELGFNLTFHRDDYREYGSLPHWARETLREHEDDPREYVYTLEQFERAQTHDDLWNAAQRQLLTEGIIHNYLRMLWGKKILEWTPTPRKALEVMLHLNDKYALDGRDPNSYSGIFWVLGRYDRAWGPERPIYGKIRYMTSESTRRKMNVKPYLARFGDAPGLFG